MTTFYPMFKGLNKQTKNKKHSNDNKSQTKCCKSSVCLTNRLSGTKIQDPTNSNCKK